MQNASIYVIGFNSVRETFTQNLSCNTPPPPKKKDIKRGKRGGMTDARVA
jgi:hypothetical protein